MSEICPLTKQIMVRLPEWLYEALKADAEENERTVAQTVRFRVNQALPPHVIPAHVTSIRGST